MFIAPRHNQRKRCAKKGRTSEERVQLYKTHGSKLKVLENPERKCGAESKNSNQIQADAVVLRQDAEDPSRGAYDPCSPDRKGAHLYLTPHLSQQSLLGIPVDDWLVLDVPRPIGVLQSIQRLLKIHIRCAAFKRQTIIKQCQKCFL
jgi:hypothetical protein